MTATTPVPTGPGLPALRRLTWWVTAACLLLVAVLVTAASAAESPDALVPALVAAATLVICAVAGFLFTGSIFGRPALPSAPLHSIVVSAALAAGGLLALSRAGTAGGFPWPLPLAALLASVHAAGSHPWRRVWASGLVLALVTSLFGSRWDGVAAWSDAVQDAAIVALGAWGLFAQVWMLRIAERLDRARGLESAAAVTGERLRFAADLHDIQGHNLQVIALKSELAERLADSDPGRAVAEMRAVQELARQALGDTRAVVQGYRRVTLDTEMTNAARVLTAAGIDCHIERDTDLPDLPGEAATLMGLVVREGTTNVLRHSEAGHCSISLTSGPGAVRLRFRNDAPLGDKPGPAGGLAALADRLTAAGGTLLWQSGVEEFAVEATVPVEVSR